MIGISVVGSAGLVLLVLAVIFVNGATDAPGAVAGAVSSGIMRYGSAVFVCALFNFLGMFVSSLWMPAVSETIDSLMNFGDNSHVVVFACLLSIIIFACAAWRFGIPTSESHALIASLAGASAYFGGTSDIGLFGTVILKSILSCALGCVVGILFLHIFRKSFRKGGVLCKNKNVKRIQYAAASLTSACHGMQDGQKFISLLFALFPAACQEYRKTSVLVCSLVMAVGCIAGGRKIINKLGYALTGGIGKAEAFASDTGSVICSAAASAAGIPISTTYMKTCSVIGACRAAGGRVDKSVAAELILVWAATYPVCMAMAYLFCMIGSGIVQ